MSDVTPIRDPLNEPLLTPKNAVLALIDYQSARAVCRRALGRRRAAGARDDARPRCNNTVLGLACELQRDWGRPGADRLRAVMREYFDQLKSSKV